MVKLLLKCVDCKSYTFEYLSPEQDSEEKKICPKCSGQLKTPHPPKFSMDNKYNKYIRNLKKEMS